MPKVTIHDIAEATGVSRGTVSRAFNERTDINSKTREMVLEVSRRMGYVPNASARRLAKGRAECVGLAIPNLSNAFFADQVTAFERKLRAYGFTAFLAITHGEAEIERSALRRMAAGQVDGVIITPCEDEAAIQFLNEVNSRVLMRRLAGEGGGALHVRLPMSLNTRQSTGPAPSTR